MSMLLIVTYSFAQTGIGTSTPHASAKLDVSSTNKGFLPPRVTLTAATDAVTIPSPAEGLLVYNLGSVGLQAGYYYWNGASWATWKQTDASGIAEFGEATIPSQLTFNTHATFDVVSFTLPSAGTWEVTYHVRGRNNLANNWGVASITNNSNVEIINSRGMIGLSGTTNSLDVSTTMTTRITTTQAETYKLRVRFIPNAGTGGSVIIFPTGEQFGGSKVVWKKIAGNLPVNQHLASANIQLNNNYLSNDGGNEGIRIDNSGNVGIGTSEPQSTLDIRGSQAQNYTAISSTSYTVLPSDNVIDLTLLGTQTVTNFTASTTNLNRLLTIVNNTSVTTKTISSYVNNLGTSVTTIPANSTLIIQSTGTTWKQINGIAASSNTTITTTNGNGSAGQLLSSNGNGTYTWVTRPTSSLRVLSNAGGTIYTQSQLQTLYNNVIGFNAPDIIPIEVVNAANALNNTNYKVFLGHNKWWYSNARSGTTSNWAEFGNQGKSDFSANIDASGLFTYK